MAQTLVTSFYHVVFSTKHRQRLITTAIEPRLFRYLTGIVTNQDSRCLAINGVEDHLHMLVALSKNHALSEFMRNLKASSTKWLKTQDHGAHRTFGWQDGYGAFSVSTSNVEKVVGYIARQKEHHQRTSFEDEYRALVRRAGLTPDERYLFD
jgi:putative transposase